MGVFGLFRRGGRPAPVSGAVVRHRRLGRVIFAAALLYGVLIFGVWGLARYEGERWWIATLLLFGPRWVLGLPLVVMIPMAGLYHRRSLWVLGVDLLLVLFPLLGLRVPWRPMVAGKSDGPTIRILTCNIHQTATSLEKLRQLIEETKPDIVTLQEYSPVFGEALFGKSDSWHVYPYGEFCLATHFKVTYQHMLPGSHKVTYKVQVPGGTIDYYNIHLASPHYVLSDAVHGDPDAADEIEANSSKRLEEAKDLTRRAIKSGGAVLMSGDFNLPADSPIYRATVGRYDDAFGVAGFGFGFSYHTRKTMVRIDHILSGPDWRCSACWVGPDVGSPHRPVIADLQRVVGE